MQRFIYSYDVGDGYTYSATDYVALEAESKDILVVALSCALIDYCTKVKKVNLEIKQLEKKKDIALKGSHKKKPDLEEYRTLSLKTMELEKIGRKFTFAGRTYDPEVFLESKRDNSDEVWEYEIKNIEQSIKSLDEWFEGMK